MATLEYLQSDSTPTSRTRRPKSTCRGTLKALSTLLRHGIVGTRRRNSHECIQYDTRLQEGDNMSKYIVYAGYRGLYKWRLVDDEGKMLAQYPLDQGFETPEEAVEAAREFAQAAATEEMDVRRPEPETPADPSTENGGNE